jgi:hypothetical protein
MLEYLANISEPLGNEDTIEELVVEGSERTFKLLELVVTMYFSKVEDGDGVGVGCGNGGNVFADGFLNIKYNPISIGTAKSNILFCFFSNFIYFILKFFLLIIYQLPHPL